MRINSVDPGFTATDFNEHRGTQTVEEAAEAIVRYALIPRDGPTGASSTETAPKPGKPRGLIPWLINSLLIRSRQRSCPNGSLAGPIAPTVYSGPAT
jgi:hypothetical protein